MSIQRAAKKISSFPLTVADAVNLTSGELCCGNPDGKITHASMLEHATDGSVCFIGNANLFSHLSDSKGITCLTTREIWDSLPDSSKSAESDRLTIIIVDNPKDRFTAIMLKLYPESKSTGKIDPMTSIADDAQIGKNVQIDAFVRIGSKARIGDNSIIKSGAVIGDNVSIGNEALIMPNVHIEHSVIGNNVHISTGSVVGHIGFGVTSDGKNQLVPHIGRVVIGDNCYLGALCAIDRGMLGDTVLGSQVIVDNHCHFSHNIQIGNGNIFCAMIGIAGSVEIGERNIFGPKVGIASHLKIGSGNLFAAKTGITKNVVDGNVMGGFPAAPIADYRLQVAALRRLARDIKSKAGKE